MNLECDPRPLIAITLGDPVGIGPEIIVKVLTQGDCYAYSRPFVLGDVSRLRAAMACSGRFTEIRIMEDPCRESFDASCIHVVPLSRLNSQKLRWGHPTRATATASLRYILAAVEWVQQGAADALVTGPLHKNALRIAGSPHAGHTELIAEKTGASDYVMLMAGSRLKVALVTLHEPLSRVPGLITPEKVVQTLRVTAQGLTERFGVSHPRLALCGLNPHAGEEGRFGTEEKRILLPALRKARRAGYRVEGPFPPDTVFYRAAAGAFDAVVALYHDQGLIPFKLLHFTDGVNTTLGLPLIRTSVDHGTAYDIAGTGAADPGSLAAAVRMAVDQVIHRRRVLGHPLNRRIGNP